MLQRLRWRQRKGLRGLFLSGGSSSVVLGVVGVGSFGAKGAPAGFGLPVARRRKLFRSGRGLRKAKVPLGPKVPFGELPSALGSNALEKLPPKLPKLGGGPEGPPSLPEAPQSLGLWERLRLGEGWGPWRLRVPRLLEQLMGPDYPRPLWGWPKAPATAAGPEAAGRSGSAHRPPPPGDPSVPPGAGGREWPRPTAGGGPSSPNGPGAGGRWDC